MDQKEIRVLLTKYYEGVTTEEEESVLAEYMSGSDVPDEFEIDKLLFTNRKNDIPEPGDDFTNRLLSITRDSALRVKLRRVKIIRVYSIAAAFALLIGSYFIIHNLNTEPSYMHDTYNDPEMAMAEVQRVLSEVSHNMNKGTKALPEIKTLGIAPATLAPFTRASRTVEESLKGLRKTNGIDSNSGLVNDIE
jgi:hypothetical protein